MAQQEMECEGNSVAEAVDAALQALGLRRDQVDVRILQEASMGFMGFGRRPARVKVIEKLWDPNPSAASGRLAPPARERPEPRAKDRRESPAPRRPEQRPQHGERRDGPPRGGRDSSRQHRRPHAPAPPPGRENPEPPVLDASGDPQACAAALAVVKELLAFMGYAQAKAAAGWDAAQERVKVNIEAAEAERLIGREGRTLEALQFLVTVMVTRELNKPVAVWVDAMGYWDRREAAVLREVRRGADTVRRTKRPFRMAPMDAAMRRLVHRALAGDPDVGTASEGEGSWRKVVLRPRGES